MWQWGPREYLYRKLIMGSACPIYHLQQAAYSSIFVTSASRHLASHGLFSKSGFYVSRHSQTKPNNASLQAS